MDTFRRVAGFVYSARNRVPVRSQSQCEAGKTSANDGDFKICYGGCWRAHIVEVVYWRSWRPPLREVLMVK